MIKGEKFMLYIQKNNSGKPNTVIYINIKRESKDVVKIPFLIPIRLINIGQFPYLRSRKIIIIIIFMNIQGSNI